ncbi:MAG: LLM class flavin-dependent oxidoreductase [Kineosporiaceae bacterium]
MTTIGCVFLPSLPPERLRGFAQAAEDAGVPELWLWEDCFLESGLATAAAVLAWTQHLRVGVGLMPTPLRNVALTAMELATLHRLFPGRLIPGVGHGVQSWMAQVGARVESPLTLLREYTLALRALLDGEEVSTQGRYVRLDGVRLGWPPAAHLGVHAGGQGPKTLRLAGEVADGSLLTADLGPDGVRAACALIEQGRAAAGAGREHRITVNLLAAIGPDAAERLARSKQRWGITDPTAGVAGGVEEVADAVRRLADVGADAVVLQPTDDEPDPEGFAQFTGRVAAALR